jgi:FkbM family methyltransferase
MKLLGFLRQLRYAPRNLARVDRQLQQVRVRLGEHGGPHAHEFGDPSVRTALISLCRPGDVAFDLGANVGVVTALLSELVGSPGRVVAFEASPRVLPLLRENIGRLPVANTSLVPMAVSDTAGSTIPLHYNDSHVSDSVMHRSEESKQTVNVATTTVDDFVARTQLVPSVIKMDIEGAEQLALAGMQDTLRRYAPHLIVETFPMARGMIAPLLAAGYRCFEPSTLRRIERESDLEGEGVTDLVYLHARKRSGSIFERPFTTTRLAQVEGEGFRSTKGGTLLHSPTFDLAPGLYMLRLQAARPSDDTVIMRLRGDEDDIFYVHCSWRRLFADRRSMVFELRRDQRVSLQVEAFDPSSLDPHALAGIELLSARWET